MEDSNVETLDQEWIDMMRLARDIGLMPEDVHAFFHASSSTSVAWAEEGTRVRIYRFHD